MQQARIGFILYLICLIVGIATFFVVRALQASPAPAFRAMPGGTTLEPPTEAKTGILTQSSGEVLHRTRIGDGFEPATPSSTIRQGESIATMRGSATVTIDGDTTLDMETGSEISFVNLIPGSFMFLQKSGTIRFSSPGSDPFSVRILRALVVLLGEAEIQTNGSSTLVTVIRGSAKASIVDADNTTHVEDAAAGQAIRINDVQRSLSVL